MLTRYGLRASVLALFVGSWIVTTGAQTASLPALTAAFLVNFAKFTEWPADHLGPSAPLEFCVADAPVADALQAAAAGRAISGHLLVVNRVKESDSLRGCA